MPRLGSEYLEPGEQAARPHRPRYVAVSQKAETIGAGLPAVEDGGAGQRPAGPDHLSTALWPALATFALVFGIGVYAFWLLHPGQRQAVSAPPRGVVLPSFALVGGWVAGVALLPRLLPRALAWLLLAAGTVFVAIVLSREVTAWLQAALGQIPL